MGMAAGKVRQPLCPAVVTRGDVMSLFGQKLCTTFFVCVTWNMTRTCGRYNIPVGQIFGILLSTPRWRSGCMQC